MSKPAVLPRRSTLESLGYDLLLHTFFQLAPGSKADLMSLMLTSRIVREAAEPALFHKIELNDVHNLTSFHSLLVQSPLRGTFIRHLLYKIHVDLVQQDEYPDDHVKNVGAHLATLLKRAENLEKLVLNEIEPLLSQSTELKSALSGCKHLTTLEVETTDGFEDMASLNHLGQALRNLHSPLRTLDIFVNRGEKFEKHVFHYLLNFQSTLSKLQLDGLDIGKCTSVGKWLKLEMLVIHRGYACVDVLERAFPNIKHLWCHMDDFLIAEVPPEDYQANQAHTCTVWKHVEWISSTTQGYAMLDIKGVEVFYMTVASPPAMLDNASDESVADAIRFLCPDTLDLDIRKKRKLSRVLCDASCIRWLKLRVHSELRDFALGLYEDNVDDLTYYLAHITDVLKPLTRLVSFELTIETPATENCQNAIETLKNNSMSLRKSMVDDLGRVLPAACSIQLHWDAIGWNA